jgi:hypothetical protein
MSQKAGRIAADSNKDSEPTRQSAKRISQLALSARLEGCTGVQSVGMGAQEFPNPVER